MGNTSTLFSLYQQQQHLQQQLQHHQQIQQQMQQQQFKKRHQQYQQHQQLIDFGVTTTPSAPKTNGTIKSALITKQSFSSVEEFLQAIKMERYTETLLNNGVDSIEKLVAVKLRDLISMGICLIGHQKKILNAIDNIKFSQNSF